MRWLADAIYLLTGLLYLPVMLYQALVSGKNRYGWRDRFGFVRLSRTTRPRVWIHAVSLGEMNTTPRVVQALEDRLPDVDIVFSTTTDTGFERGVQLYGRRRVFRFPLDFSTVVSRVLRRVRPSLVVLVELEVWYNLVRLATRKGIPVAVINGRLTEQSVRRLRKLGPLARSMFSDLCWIGAQDEEIAARFRLLGARPCRVEVTSSLKWDSATIADQVDGAQELAATLGIDHTRPNWVCGSTGAGEEPLLLDAYRQALALMTDRPPRLILVPRKPERFDEVARLIASAGFACVRRSERVGDAAPTTPPEAVILGDTMGELRKFYSLANVVFVGRTLVPLGGSDPMEVAALGKPMIVGPHTENFQLPVATLEKANAIRRVAAATEIPAALAAILQDKGYAQAAGARARQTVRDNQGATARTVDRLAAILRQQQAGVPACQG